MLPPLIAKLTELNKPPITKKNKNIFTTDLFSGLRVSEGFIARSVIRIPYRNPTAIAGMNIKLIKIGDSLFMAFICGKNIKNNNKARKAEDKNKIRFRYLCPDDSEKSYVELYIFEYL